jgi:hypothetical protein
MRNFGILLVDRADKNNRKGLKLTSNTSIFDFTFWTQVLTPDIAWSSVVHSTKDLRFSLGFVVSSSRNTEPTRVALPGLLGRTI